MPRRARISSRTCRSKRCRPTCSLTGSPNSSRGQITARHRALNWLRSRKERVVALDESVLELMETQWAREAMQSEGERIEALRQCMEGLPAHSRQMLQLRYVEERPCQEVARTLGMKLDAIYQRLARLHRAGRVHPEAAGSGPADQPGDAMTPDHRDQLLVRYLDHNLTLATVIMVLIAALGLLIGTVAKAPARWKNAPQGGRANRGVSMERRQAVRPGSNILRQSEEPEGQRRSRTRIR